MSSWGEVAIEVGLGLPELRAVLGHVGFGLPHRGGQRALIE